MERAQRNAAAGTGPPAGMEVDVKHTPANAHGVNRVDARPDMVKPVRQNHRPEPFQAFWLALKHQSYSISECTLTFPSGVFVLGSVGLGSVLYRRPCYQGLRQAAEQFFRNSAVGHRGLLLTGNPGIGKSLFLCDVLVELALTNCSVVYERILTREAFCCAPDGSVTVTSSGSGLVRRLLTDQNNYYLFDAAGSGHGSVAPLFLGNVVAKTIAVSTPDTSCFQAYEKWYSYRLYMPCWSLEEALQARRACFPLEAEQAAEERGIAIVARLSVEAIQQRFAIWGGMARWLFFHDAGSEMAISRLTIAIENARILDVLGSAGMLETMEDVCHHIFHYDVAANFEYVSLKFASDFVFNRLMQSSRNKLSDGLIKFVCASTNQSMLGPLRGYIFERFAHAVIARGGQFRIRRLVSSDSKEQVAEDKIVVPALSTVGFHTAEEIPGLIVQHLALLEQQAAAAHANLYLRPSIPNYPFLASLAVFGLFVLQFTLPSNSVQMHLTAQSWIHLYQATVGKKHPLKLEYFRHLRDQLRFVGVADDVVLPLFILLPEDRFVDKRVMETYQTQRGDDAVTAPPNVVQYALCVPLLPGTPLDA